MSPTSALRTTQSGPPSDYAVYSMIKKGFAEHGIIYVSAGLITGAMASVVLGRGGGVRKGVTAFGGGIGLGSAWTRTSINIENMLNKEQYSRREK